MIADPLTHNDEAHRQNLAYLANIILVARRGQRLEAAGMLLTFRWHERCRLRARWCAGYGAIPSPHEQRYHDLLLAGPAAIMSSMTNECEVLA